MRHTILIPITASLAFVAAPANAGSAVVIWPVDPVIAAESAATALWVENRGVDPVTIQVRTYGWRQNGGEDEYVAQSDVVSSPPIARIAPGQRQLIRLIRRTPSVASAEQAFRLLIDELPGEVRGADRPVSDGLAVQMRYSIPLFVHGFGDASRGESEAGQPMLRARVALIDGGRHAMITNTGAKHARITDLRIGQGGTARMVRGGLVGYVLPGATMRWALPDDIRPNESLTIDVNGATHTLPVNA